MPRVKRGTVRTAKRRALLRQTKGYHWGRKNLTKLAKTAVKKAGVYAFRDRHNKKRTARALWQIRLNAALRPLGLKYSLFIDLLNKNNIALDRKILADLAIEQPALFAEIVAQLKK